MHTQPRTPQAVPYFQRSAPRAQQARNRPIRADAPSAHPPSIGLQLPILVMVTSDNGSHKVREPITERPDEGVKATVVRIWKKMGTTHIYLLGKRCTALTDTSSMYDLSGEEIRSDQYWLFAITKKEKGHHVPYIVKTLERKYAPVNLCIGTATQKDLWSGLSFLLIL